MTHKEFLDKFNSTYSRTAKEYATKLSSPEAFKQTLAKYSENGTTISNEDLAVWAFMESTQFTKAFLQSVLEDVLEFED